MRKAEKILAEYFKWKDINEECVCELVPVTLVDMLEEAQEEAYNQALQDAIKNVKMKTIIVRRDGVDKEEIGIDRDSIKKLAK